MKETTQMSKRLLLLALAAIPFLGLACGDDDKTTDPPGDYVFLTDAPSAFARIDRMGMPAVATALIAADHKQGYNQQDPINDGTAQDVGDVTATLNALHTALDEELTALGVVPCGIGSCIAQAASVAIPDLIKIDVAGAAGFPNGRKLDDQVIDITLAVLLLDLSVSPSQLRAFADLPVNPEHNDKTFSNTFPYLATKH